MEEDALYLVIKQLINSIDSGFKVRHNNLIMTEKNSVRVTITSGYDSGKRSLSDGHYYNRGSRVQVLVQSGDDLSSLHRAKYLVSKLIDTLSMASNKQYIIQSSLAWEDNELVYKEGVTDSNVKVNILKSDKIGSVTFEGKTSERLQRYSINFNIQYSVGGV